MTSCLGDDLDFANERECEHFNTQWYNEQIDENTNEILGEYIFEKCLDCGEIFYEE